MGPQDTTALRESPHARELRYVENLEEVKAKILILEQQLADQPGSKDLQNKLVHAREWQTIWERNLGFVQSLRKSLLKVFENFVRTSCHS